jgi:release factor H-coupled RctB family protein
MNSTPARVESFYTAKTWVSPDAITQLRNASLLPGVVRIAAMPDIHPGAGSPGGVVFASRGVIYPKLIGGDIGCGMQLCRTSIDARVNVRRLADSLGSIDDVWDGNATEYLGSHQIELPAFERVVGTIGGGNHFAELQVVHEIHDATTCHSLDIDTKKALLLVHSGSRSYGQAVLQQHSSNSDRQGLDPESAAGKAYLAEHQRAVQFAKANRSLIAQRFAERTGSEVEPLLDLCHNYVAQQSDEYGPIWLHRKGAAPADQGLVVIPGSRSSLSYLVRPIGDGIANLFSLAHGAGRKISRSQSDEKFGQIAIEELRRPRDKSIGLDNLVICEQRNLLRQEHGKAYKDIERVIDDMKAFGLLEIVATFRPILTYKTRSDSDDGEG